MPKPRKTEFQIESEMKAKARRLARKRKREANRQRLQKMKEDADELVEEEMMNHDSMPQKQDDNSDDDEPLGKYMPYGKGLNSNSQSLLNDMLERGMDHIYGKGVSDVLTTTTSHDLEALAKGLPKFRIFPVDKLPKRLTAGTYIINSDVSTGPGEHWVALYSGPKQEYTVIYDSFGVTPDPRILKFAKTGKKKVIGLNTQIQDLNSQACGQYCIDFLRSMHKGISPAKYLSQWHGEDQSKNEKKLREKFAQDGDGIVDSFNRFSNKLMGRKDVYSFPNEKHLPGGYNWAGPGTNLDRRIPMLRQGKSKPTSDIDQAALQHDINYAVLRKYAAKGMPESEILRLTRAVDNHFIKRVAKSKDDNRAIKNAVIGTFRAKAMKENRTGKSMFVHGGPNDPPANQIPNKLDFKMKGAFNYV